MCHLADLYYSESGPKSKIPPERQAYSRVYTAERLVISSMIFQQDAAYPLESGINQRHSLAELALTWGNHSARLAGK